MPQSRLRGTLSGLATMTAEFISRRSRQTASVASSFAQLVTRQTKHLLPSGIRMYSWPLNSLPNAALDAHCS